MDKATSFINTLHQLWMLDAFTMEEYIDMIWPYMLRHGVNWKQKPSTTYVSGGGVLNKVIEEPEELFASAINDKAHDSFPVFAETCHKFMDFSMLEKAERRERA